MESEKIFYGPLKIHFVTQFITGALFQLIPLSFSFFAINIIDNNTKLKVITYDLIKNSQHELTFSVGINATFRIPKY